MIRSPKATALRDQWNENHTVYCKYNVIIVPNHITSKQSVHVQCFAGFFVTYTLQTSERKTIVHYWDHIVT